METQWEKVARWARMGNDRKTSESTDEGAMEDEMTGQGSDVQEPELVTGSPEVEQSTSASEAGQAELEQMQGERDQLRDRLVRLQAEFDNARKREAKEKQDARDYAIQGAVEPFLGVLDNFALALKAEGTAEQMKAGVEMIVKQMEDALRGMSVQAVETVGAQFDPRVHEALGSIETKEFPDHQVMEEIRRGYRLRDKLLRPALVRIASNPDQVSE